jgi:hypothetical protein
MPNKFDKHWTKAKRQEMVVSWIFRLATYFVLLCVTYIFADIAWNGGEGTLPSGSAVCQR